MLTAIIDGRHEASRFIADNSRRAAIRAEAAHYATLTSGCCRRDAIWLASHR